jgi:FMN phosphatase YigB (HAD superfamily)
MIETLLSDLGNVLLTFDNGLFFRALAGHSRLKAPEIERVAFENVDLAVLFEKGAISEIDFYRNAKELFAAEVEFGEFFALYCDVFAVNAPVLDLYRRLRPKVRMALISSTDIMRWTFIKRRFPELLFFDAYALSFDLGAMKPDPIVYREALRLAGGRPETAISVESIEANVSFAKSLGLDAVLYKPGLDLGLEILPNMK